MTSRRFPWLSLPAICVLMAACSSPVGYENSDEGISLVDRFELAELDWQVRSIDFGTAEARRHLTQGWGYDETGWFSDAVWALGPRAALQVFLAQPRDLELVMDVRRPEFGSSPPPWLTVTVNGRVAGTVELKEKFGTPRRLTVPASLWSTGTNQVDFETSATAVPSRHTDRRDGRPLAAFWNGLAMRPLEESAAPFVHSAAAEVRHLVMPYGSQVVFSLRLQPGAQLILPSLEGPRGLAGPGRLQVLLEPASEGESQQWQIDSEANSVRLALVEREGPYRLTLRSEAASPDRVGRGTLTLVDPRITGLADDPALPPANVPASIPLPEIERESTRPNVLLYVVDTLRADHVGSYGYPRGTTPHLDALASDGMLFEHARAQSSWTRPTVASILSGLYPQRHGTNGETERLSTEVGTLPEWLREAGYATAAVVTNGVVSQQFGFDRGFDSFLYLAERPGVDPRIHRGAEVLHRAALEWIEARDRSRPFFLYLHATDPHAPYRPPERWRKQFAPSVDPALGDHDRVAELEWNPDARTPGLAADLRALYDAEIAHFDHEWGRLVVLLREIGLYDETLIVLLSDHGEEFGDHGRWQHGMTLNEEQLRVPLIVKLPQDRLAGTRIAEVAEQVDIAPTILAATGNDQSIGFLQGRNLLDGARLLDQVEPMRMSLALLARQPQYRHVESLVADGRKLLHHRVYDRAVARLQLFDLTTDPGERADLARLHPVEVGFLRSRLRRVELLLRPAAVDEALVDEELRKSLRAVGYLD